MSASGALPTGGEQAQTLGFMFEEMQSLNQEINSLKRETRAVLGLVVTAAGIVAPLQQAIDTNIAAILLPFLLVGLGAYGANLNAEIAALAEQRDRLIGYVNRVGGTKALLHRVTSDNRRGSLGTALTYILAFAIVAASIGVGGYYAGQEATWVFWAFTAFMAFSLVALAGAITDLPMTRHHVNRALDDEVGDIDRPATSPSSELSRWEVLKGWRSLPLSLFGRRGQAVAAPPRQDTDRWHTFVVPQPPAYDD